MIQRGWWKQHRLASPGDRMSQQPPRQSEPARGWHDEDSLIDKYIEPHPHKHGAGDARLAGLGYSVWGLIMELQAYDNDMDRVAQDYQVSEEAIRAVLAFYRRHPAAIDAKILEHDVFFGVRA